MAPVSSLAARDARTDTAVLVMPPYPAKTLTLKSHLTFIHRRRDVYCCFWARKGCCFTSFCTARHRDVSLFNVARRRRHCRRGSSLVPGVGGRQLLVILGCSSGIAAFGISGAGGGTPSSDQSVAWQQQRSLIGCSCSCCKAVASRYDVEHCNILPPKHVSWVYQADKQIAD